LGHLAFKSNVPKGENMDYNKPLYILPGSDAFQHIFKPNEVVSGDRLKEEFIKAALASGLGGSPSPKQSAKGKKLFFDPKFAEPLIDQECKR
jgi:hypothetical protein